MKCGRSGAGGVERSSGGRSSIAARQSVGQSGAAGTVVTSGAMSEEENTVNMEPLLPQAASPCKKTKSARFQVAQVRLNTTVL